MYEKVTQSDNKKSDKDNCNSYEISIIKHSTNQPNNDNTEIIGRHTYNFSELNTHNNPSTSSVKSDETGLTNHNSTEAAITPFSRQNSKTPPYLPINNLFAEKAPIQGKNLQKQHCTTTPQGDPYSGTPLKISNKLSKNIQYSFGINTKELSLRESPEVSKMDYVALCSGSCTHF